MGLPALWKTSGDCAVGGIREFGYASGDLVVPIETRQAASLRESFLDLTHQLAQRLLVRRAGYAAFGDDGGYVFCGGYVEGRVFDLDSVGDHLLAGNVRDFPCVALLDWNFAAVGRGEIDGRSRRCDVERDTVFFRQDGYCVGADLVGHVSVGSDTISTDDDGSDFSLLHHDPSHVVGDDGGGDAIFHQ